MPPYKHRFPICLLFVFYALRASHRARSRFGKAYHCFPKYPKALSFARFFSIFFPLDLLFFYALLRPDDLLVGIVMIGSAIAFPLVFYSLIRPIAG